uniref:Uncharacterized protein n=1 Tax=Pseudo-nitzschia australis TaxID=44445 RepID=A0A7S4A9U7_9STRA|mmetsp:Transcript_11554/g.24475  ORF Transcript_11554/g.24475 Transcript_11554/m.24475 type:complete len:307 (+) Transcript_11554:111-1031(+)
MILKSAASALLLLVTSHTSGAWTTIQQTSKAVPGVGLSSVQSYRLLSDLSKFSTTPKTFLSATENADAEDGNAAPKRKRKRKKKAQIVDVVDTTTDNQEDAQAPKPAESVSAAPVLDLKPREDEPVQLEIKNIVASTAEPEPSAIATVSAMLSSVMGSKDKTGSSSSMPGSSSTTNDISTSSMNNFAGRPLDDSLDQLLEDARVMTEEELEAKKENGILSDEQGTDVKKMIGNALSTIVTADFFLVCAFLVWFLAGIFCSYVLKDDTVQILFNNQFERLVQPSLGLLMIAAIGGSFFKEEEQEYDL